MHCIYPRNSLGASPEGFFAELCEYIGLVHQVASSQLEVYFLRMMNEYPEIHPLRINHILYSPTICICIGPLDLSLSAEPCFDRNAVAESLSVFDRATLCGWPSSSGFEVNSVGRNSVNPSEVLGSVKIVNTVVMILRTLVGGERYDLFTATINGPYLIFDGLNTRLDQKTEFKVPDEPQNNWAWIESAVVDFALRHREDLWVDHEIKES